MEAVGKSIRGPQRMLVSHGSLKEGVLDPRGDCIFVFHSSELSGSNGPKTHANAKNPENTAITQLVSSIKHGLLKVKLSQLAKTETQ